MKNPIVEGIKEALRVAVITALPVIGDALASGSFSWKITAIAAGVAALKGIDKWMHEDPVVPFKGLLPF